MAIAADDVGTGATIGFGTSTFVAHILSVNGNDITRPVLDATHMESTTTREKIFGDLYDPGGVDVEIALDPDAPVPIGAAVETVTITFPIPAGKGSGATLIGLAAISNWSWGVPLEDKMTASFTLTWTGKVAAGTTGPVWAVSAA